MLGRYLNILGEYLFRVVRRKMQLRCSSSWPRVTAAVNFSSLPNNSFGCTLAELSYVYKVDGEFYAGTFTKPFLRRSPGENYIARFPSETQLLISVKPDEPSVSIVDERESASLEPVKVQSN
jgi:hypothetical protein